MIGLKSPLLNVLGPNVKIVKPNVHNPSVTVRNKVFSVHQDIRIRVWKFSRRSENVFRLLDTLPMRKDYLGKFMEQSNYVQTRRHHKNLWIEHLDSISCLAVSISNGLIYYGSWDKTLKVWRISDLKCLESIKAHDDAINRLVSCKEVVYSASADGKIKYWGKIVENVNTSHSLKGILVVAGHDGVFVNVVDVLEGGKWVYGGGSDGFMMGWEGNRELVSWKLIREKKAHDMAVLCLSIVGEFLCSGSATWQSYVFPLLKSSSTGALRHGSPMSFHCWRIRILGFGRVMSCYKWKSPMSSY